MCWNSLYTLSLNHITINKFADMTVLQDKKIVLQNISQHNLGQQFLSLLEGRLKNHFD